MFDTAKSRTPHGVRELKPSGERLRSSPQSRTPHGVRELKLEVALAHRLA